MIENIDIADITEKLTFCDNQWWNSAASLHINYQNNRIRNNGIFGVVSDINTSTNSTNLSSNGLHIPTGSVSPVTFSDLSWLDPNDYTIVIRAYSTTTATNRRLLGFSGSGRGIITDGPDKCHFLSGSSIQVDSSVGSSRFDDSGGMIVVFTGDQYGRSIVCGDRGLASTSDLSISMTTLYIGERNTGGNEFDGYIYEFYHIPKRIYDNAARLLANPNHDLTTTADLIADSSLTAREGNKYHTLNSIETSTRLADNIQIGLEVGSSFSGDPLNVASVTGAKLITTGTGPAPIVYGRIHQTSWTLIAGQTNTYEASVNMTDWAEAGVSQHCTLFESTAPSSTLSITDIPLTLQTSIANVEANAGSYYVDYTVSGTGTVYLHPTDSDNPNSNGFAYSYTDGDRKVLEDFLDITGPMVIDNIPTDDGLIVEENGTYDNIIIQHSHTHALFVRPNGVAKNIIAKNTINAGQGVSPFVANTSQPAGTFMFDGCEVIQDANFDRDNCGGFFSHKSGSIAEYTNGTIKNSTISNSGFSGGCIEFTDTLEVDIQGNSFLDCNRCIKIADDNTNVIITKNFASGSNATNQNIQRFLWSGNVTDPTVYLHGNVIYHYGNSGGLIYITHPGTYYIQYNTFAGNRASGDPLAIRVSNADAIVNIRNNIFHGQRWNIFIDGDFKDNITFENNIVHDYTSGFSYNGDTSMTLSEFETALAISSSTNLQIDPAFTNTPDSWSQLTDATTSENEVANRNAGSVYYSCA